MNIPMDTNPAEGVERELPRFDEFFVPALACLNTMEEATAREVISRVADEMHLDEGQRSQTIPSGQRRLDNRVTWALSYLYQARAVAKPRRGVFRITERGAHLLRQHPGGFGADALRQFEEFVSFQGRSRTRADGRSVAAGAGEPVEGDTPLEQVSSAVARLDAAVAAELVERLLEHPPEFLEKAVLRLLVAMGYGGSEGAAEHLGGPGDGGFDGVINQDRLGLGRVYVQAKRYAVDNIVGRPAVQGFVGALHGAGAAGGVLITTSRFSPDAVAFAKSITPRVILIDGSRLGELMVTHGVGVQERQTFRVVELDEDFFE